MSGVGNLLFGNIILGLVILGLGFLLYSYSEKKFRKKRKE